MNEHTASCRCGATRYKFPADPFYAGYCHCGDCRRASGSLVAAFVGFYTAEASFIGEIPSTYGKAPISRSFCGKCGAPLSFLDQRLPDQIFMMLGAMDTPEKYPPTAHGYVHEALPFFHFDDLPRLEANTVPRP
jgi:hypothetical protein